MSGFIECLNGWGASFLVLAVDRAVAASIVFAVVALVFFVGRRFLSAHASSWLWLIPIVPLVIPVDRWTPVFETAVAPAEKVRALVVPRPEPATEPSQVTTTTRLGVTAPAPRQSVPAPARPRSASLQLPAVLLLGWGLVVVVLLVRFAWRQLAWRRHVAGLERDDGALARRVRRLTRRAGLRFAVDVARSDTLDSPATSGGFRPVILVPRALPERLSVPQTDWVLLHELAHVRRGDLFIELGQRLVQILWWWHPLVWIANAEVARHRECACDDAASSLIAPTSRRSAAHAFFEILAAAARAPAPSPALVSLVDHKTQLRRRLMRLLDDQRTVTGRSTVAALLGVVACALGAFTVAGAQEPGRVATEATRAVQKATLPHDAEQQARIALERGVQWLVQNQQEDGSWRAGKRDAKGRGVGLETTASTTARAVLALIDGDALGGTEASRRALDSGVKWLESHQGKRGLIGSNVGWTWNYGHALSTLALCAAQRRAPTKERLEKIHKAVEFVLAVQNPYKGWRYGERDGDNDAKITSLMLMSLREAQALGAQVSRHCINWGESVLEELRDPRTGRVGWLRKGGAVGRLYVSKDTHPAELSEEVTAQVLVSWMDAGRRPDRDPFLPRAVALVASKLPEWNDRKGSTDFLYWYWGARLFHKLGGPNRKAWRQATLEALLPKVRWESDGTATWPLEDAWSLPGLEAYATATCVRTLSHILAD